MKMKMFFLMFLMPCIMHAEYFDNDVILKHTKNNLAMLQLRLYKQKGYGALIGATVFGAGYSILTFNDNVAYMANTAKMHQMEAQTNLLKNIHDANKVLYDSAIFSKPKATYFNSIAALVTDVTKLVVFGLTSSAVNAVAHSIASKNGVLKDAYSDIVATFTLPDENWYIEHYVPLYKHLDSFKYCAVYFDLNSPFLLDVHSNAITMQYIQTLIDAGQPGRVSGYAQFLQRKAQTAVGNAQELLQYDECLAAYRYRKQQGQTIEEDNSLLNKMHEFHTQIVEDLEKMVGFVYALSEHNMHSMDEFEKDSMQYIISKMRAYAERITSLLNGTDQEREQASLQGNGLFTAAHEFELYLRTIFRS